MTLALQRIPRQHPRHRRHRRLLPQLL